MDKFEINMVDVPNDVKKLAEDYFLKLHKEHNCNHNVSRWPQNPSHSNYITIKNVITRDFIIGYMSARKKINNNEEET
jgi:hypothetical protein